MRTETPDTVFILDDDPAVREALLSLLRSVGLEAQAFANFAEFTAAPRPDAACCLVLDIRMPGRSGLDIQSDLAKAEDHLPIIFITGHGDIPMSVRAMKSGAVEFLSKPFRDQDLLDAINEALERDRSRRAAEDAISELGRRLESLTQREREVMALVASGLLNKQIAGDLGLAEITVKIHRGQVMKKMGARSLADLVRMADRLGVKSNLP